MKTLILVVTMLLFAQFPGRAAEKNLSEKDKIEGLISHIERLAGAKFIRNGSAYDAKTAARFLRGKWQRDEKQIKTASDFIEKVGTQSSTTGKPYLIRLPDGREVKCAEYLKGLLKRQDGESGKS
jgi:hypothetical protein